MIRVTKKIQELQEKDFSECNGNNVRDFILKQIESEMILAPQEQLMLDDLKIFLNRITNKPENGYEWRAACGLLKEVSELEARMQTKNLDIPNIKQAHCVHDIKRLRKPEDGWTHACHKCGRTWSI